MILFLDLDGVLRRRTSSLFKLDRDRHREVFQRFDFGPRTTRPQAVFDARQRRLDRHVFGLQDVEPGVHVVETPVHLGETGVDRVESLVHSHELPFEMLEQPALEALELAIRDGCLGQHGQ